MVQVMRSKTDTYHIPTITMQNTDVRGCDHNHPPTRAKVLHS